MKKLLMSLVFVGVFAGMKAEAAWRGSFAPRSINAENAFVMNVNDDYGYAVVFSKKSMYSGCYNTINSVIADRAAGGSHYLTATIDAQWIPYRSNGVIYRYLLVKTISQCSFK